MITIQNSKDFRFGYELLGLLKNLASVNPDAAQSRTVEIKHELRAYAKKKNKVDVGRGIMVERRIIKDEGIDGYVEIVRIPVRCNTLDSAKDFFECYIEKPSHYSAYDCTGRAFTCWYKLVKRNNQYWAYHRVGLDT